MVTHPCVPRTLILLPELTESCLLLFSQIRELLNLGLVEPVDNRILTCLNVYALDLLYISNWEKHGGGNAE